MKLPISLMDVFASGYVVSSNSNISELHREGRCSCGEVEDVVGVLTPVVGGVAQVFHDLLVEVQLLFVAEVEEREEEDRQKEGWEVESGVQGEEVAHMDDKWMTMGGVRARLELEPM